VNRCLLYASSLLFSVINFVGYTYVCSSLRVCVNLCLSGIQQLLTVAGTIPEHKTLAISQNSRMHVSLCLSKVYEDLVSDQERDLFIQATNSYFEYAHFPSFNTCQLNGTYCTHFFGMQHFRFGGSPPTLRTL